MLFLSLTDIKVLSDVFKLISLLEFIQVDKDVDMWVFIALTDGHYIWLFAILFAHQ